ncbi:MAG: ATP-dependent RNA helicase HrpA [Acidimicrobiia bacterium]
MGPPTPTTAALRDRLEQASIADAHRLGRRLRNARRKTGEARRRAVEGVAAELDRAVAAMDARRASAVVPTYPADLPITARRDELLGVLRDHQVVIVAGETGSGKSTQLPKLCLELGRGVRGLIGHTQPRRIAARSVAERVAEELGVEVGGQVGYAVRFTDQAGPDTRLKVMTDGILLNELQRDRLLLAYDTIIVDEAHERSLNIDFILGYLKELLPRRPDLKVVVTSATIDTERFAEHFADESGPAPIVEVSGRTYPVELRYRPDDDGQPPEDTVQAVADAVGELVREGPGDVLVFASGEREIRDMADAVEGLKLPGTEVLPLFARLSSAEQHRVFAGHTKRRVVIATNIAETSITVPGIRYVVDPGTARISRYSKRTKVQRLPIEAISQASADQRAGRCGRVAPGICIRLYGEDDYDARPQFTEPEILRTNLASVILQMTAIGLGDVESFPFVEPPDRRNVADGVTLLEELGALEPDHPADDRRLTEIGRRLARLPLDPSLGRMVLEAEGNGCVHEVMVIVAGLSIQDPRERPTGQEERAGQLHARFRVPGSDFLGYLALWDHVKERQRELSSSKFRKECRDELLHFVRLREWQDVYTQIRQVVRSLGMRIDREPADADAIHRSLLAGLLANVANRDDSAEPTAARGPARRGPKPPTEYVGPRGARFALARGSVLSKSPPRWVMVAEIVETNRLWARTGATIQPSWIEQAAGHLLTRTHEAPHWNRDRGSAQVIERVRLRALTIVEGRAVNLDRVDRGMARELFILHALVRGEWDAPHPFVARNAERIAEVRAMEDRARRRDILVDEDRVFDVFDARIPDHVTDVRRFDRWWRDAGSSDPHLLDLTADDLVVPGTTDVDDAAFPDRWQAAPTEIRIDYEFEPGQASDGTTFEVPVAVLNRTEPEPFEWLVPGLRLELVTALIKALPKQIRRSLVPAPDRAAELLTRVGPDDGRLRDVVAAELSRMAGVPVDPALWDDVALPGHLRPRYRVVGEGRTLAEGDDLRELERRLRAHVRATVVSQAPELERSGLTSWTIGTLPRVVESTVDGLTVQGYPAVIDTRDSVGVRILASVDQQRALHWNGVRRLLALQLGKPARALQKRLDARVLLGLTAAPHATVTAAVDDALHGVLDALLLAAGGPPFDEEGFVALRRSVQDRWLDDLVVAVATLSTVVQHADRIADRLAQPAPVSWSESLDDVTRQLTRLVFDGMVVSIGTDRLAHVPRYLDAIDARLDKLREGPAKDVDRLRTVARLEAEHADLVATHGLTAALDDVRWLIEELRVQLFAQQLGTPVSVSEKRIRERLQRIRRP